MTKHVLIASLLLAVVLVFIMAVRQHPRSAAPPAPRAPVPSPSEELPFTFVPPEEAKTNAATATRVEFSREWQRKVGNCVLAYAQAVARGSRSNLFVRVSGEAKVRVDMGTNNVGRFYASNATVNVYFGDSWAGVDNFGARGKDEFGLPRDVNDILNEWDFAKVAWVISGWAANYPIKTAPEDLRASLEGFAKDFIPSGYKVAQTTQMSRGTNTLPFVYCMLVPEGVNRFGNWAQIMLYVRNGGNDLQPGQGEIIFYQSVAIWDSTYQEGLKLHKPDASTFKKIN